MSSLNPIISKGINFIQDHLNESIQVEDVASYCNFSKFYFNRLFKRETGESIYAFIQRLRLEKSAVYLANDHTKTITEIGENYGYSSSNYSTAFKKYHRQTPVEFREKIQASKLDLKNPFSNRSIELKSLTYYNSRIEIRELKDIHVLFERHIGSYKELPGLWQSFLTKYSEVRKSETIYIEKTYDDPLITEPHRCIYDLCMMINEDMPIEKDKKMIIEGGKIAAFSFKGHYTEIFEAYKGVFYIWLPQSPYRLAKRSVFDIYSRPSFKDGYIEMDMCFPLELRTISEV